MLQPNDRTNELLRRAGASFAAAAKSLVDFARAILEYVAAICPPEILKGAKVQQALKEAPPRVRHLAHNSKKHRVQKKNINRALREYQRRTEK